MKRKTKLLFRDAFLSTILSCILLGIISLVFFNVRFFNPIHKTFKDFSFLDVYFSEKFEEDSKVNDEIIIVNIENHDREVIATLLESILAAKPKVVGFDIILEKHQNHYESDSLLAELLKNKKVVTAFDVQENEIIKNEAFFEDNNESAYVNFNFNKDNVIREFQGISNIFGQDRLSFATKISKSFLSNKKWKKYKYDERLTESQYINYTGNIEKFPTLTIDDFLFSDSKEFLKDKIVLLGYAGLSTSDNNNDITDKYWTPLNDRIAGKSDRDMYGVVVHANIINMLINDNLLYKVSNFWLGLITFMCMYMSTMIYMKLNRKYKISYRTRKQAYQLIFAIILLVIVFWLLKNDVVLRPFIIILGILLAGSYFKYYKHLARYIKTKRKWKTYLK